MTTNFNIEPIEKKLQEYHSKSLKVFATSSFQSHSLPLLHILSRIDNSIPIYFLDTGYHFPETLLFRDQVTELMGLNLISISSPIPKIMQRDASGKLMFASDPTYCCYMNKILPLEPVIKEMDVWISGVRGDQTANRKAMHEEEYTPDGSLRYHPMLHWNSKMIYQYAKAYNLPKHPLEEKGYLSIGCEPCTQSMFDEMAARGGRWSGMKKTECGLHTDLIKRD